MADMDADRVVEIVSALAREGIDVWLDGGWGVDALLGEQTRTHADLDLAVDRRDMEGIQSELEQLGFRVDPSAEPGLPARAVLKNERSQQVDLHPLIFDGMGNGWQQLSSNGGKWGRYPADDLTASGVVRNHTVRCLSPALQFRFRLGYDWAEKDRHDLRQLQRRFGVGPPLRSILADES